MINHIGIALTIDKYGVRAMPIHTVFNMGGHDISTRPYLYQYHERKGEGDHKSLPINPLLRQQIGQEKGDQ